MEFKKPTIGISSFLLLLLVSAAAAARPTRQLVANDGTVSAPAVAPAAADVAAGVADAPVAAANADVPAAAAAMGPVAGAAAAGAPIGASTIPVAAGAGAVGMNGGGGGGDHPMLPFARPNGAVLPLNSGVNVKSGAAGAIDNNNIPFLTGLGGATNAAFTSNSNNNNNGVPVFAGGSLPQGTTLQKLLFGTMTVVDDELTEAPGLGSPAVGRAQGFYIASSEEGVSQTVVVTAMFKEGEFADSISFFGVHRTADSESHLAVVGGTGKFAGVKGFAKVAVVRPGGVAATAAEHETDGVETVLQFTVLLIMY
ncbi:hypothetical protein OsJ_00431 [Oryza sativa Japonica Group]|uniref:Dirigent protein n=1 Tax=Oryza sativa subsp. japonica TaxID=39947 RepID=A2ZPF2_ORYSJ|nr:hypothetical protein OsJ_00431 [Oryza sativa Japonica Group]